MTRIKGQLTTADPLAYDEFQRLLKCLHENGLYRWEAFCKISFCTALRVSDVRTTCWGDILDKDEMFKLERKTQKTRLIRINSEIRNEISRMYELLGRPNKNLSVIANPRTGKPYSREHINEMLKLFRLQYKLQIRAFSSHTFRKTFGRYVYDTMGRTAEALILLNQIFKHFSLESTRRYLGLRQDEIDGVFNSLSFTRDNHSSTSAKAS